MTGSMRPLPTPSSIALLCIALHCLKHITSHPSHTLTITQVLVRALGEVPEIERPADRRARLWSSTAELDGKADGDC